MATSPQPAGPPLSLEAVTGWRIWRLVREEGVLTLASVTRADTWPPDEPMLARCAVHRGKTIPDVACMCGLYAASTPENLAATRMFSPASCVVGAIAMWGTLVEHERGARSRLAYPARLRLVCGACLSAGAGAIDPKTVVDSDGVLTAVCTKHSKGVTGPSWPADQVQAELLSTYGVDLMPIERVAKSLRTGSVVTRSAPPEPVKVAALALWSIVKMLLTGLFMLWAYSGLIFVALALVFGAFNAVTQALGLAPAKPAAAAPVATAPPPSTSIVAWSPHIPAAPIVSDFPDRGVHPALVTLPPFAVVCGMGSGVLIDVVACKVDGADLLGWAERSPPHGPKEDCVGRWDAYAHGRRFWICWNDFLETSDIERWVHSPNPWSIPVDEGGAIHEHR
jgi:hypothetical protein